MRLRGIDAPELMTEAGPKAKAALEKWLSRESSGLSHERKAVSDGSPLKTQDILIHAEKTDKYNRSLANLWVMADSPARSAASEKMTESSRAVFESKDSNVEASVGSTQLTKAEYINRKLLDDGLVKRLEE